MASKKTFQVISPVNGKMYIEREYADAAKMKSVFAQAEQAFHEWRNVDLETRIRYCEKAVQSVVAQQLAIAEQITWQMGRPIRYTPGEVRGFAERAQAMLQLAKSKLNDITIEPKDGFKRSIHREPLGVVFSISPWNYPFLTTVNLVIPALLAGNVVVMKASAQTPLTSETLQSAFDEAKLPAHVFQSIHLDHAGTQQALQTAPINYVGFTGSVDGGKSIERALAGRFIGLGLELGGKDPAYVREDAPFEHSVANIVDGAYFNSGQSCCGIERVYVHKKLFPRFVDAFVAEVEKYKLDDPTNPETTLGPVVRNAVADKVREQVKEAVAKGARQIVNQKLFPKAKEGTPYIAPQVLVDVDHSMALMREENFGPVVGIMSVDSDEQAVKLMNDSHYGLTASVWTHDIEQAQRLGNEINTGTVFMNRCDYLDPYLAWTGVKDSGRGCTLSEVGYEHLTRPKSFHLKIV